MIADGRPCPRSSRMAPPSGVGSLTPWPRRSRPLDRFRTGGSQPPPVRAGHIFSQGGHMKIPEGAARFLTEAEVRRVVREELEMFFAGVAEKVESANERQEK